MKENSQDPPLTRSTSALQPTLGEKRTAVESDPPPRARFALDISLTQPSSVPTTEEEKRIFLTTTLLGDPEATSAASQTTSNYRSFHLEDWSESDRHHILVRIAWQLVIFSDWGKQVTLKDCPGSRQIKSTPGRRVVRFLRQLQSYKSFGALARNSHGQSVASLFRSLSFQLLRSPYATSSFML